MALDIKSYTSILYGNGPGYQINAMSRPNVNSSESGKGPRRGMGGGCWQES